MFGEDVSISAASKTVENSFICERDDLIPDEEEALQFVDLKAESRDEAAMTLLAGLFLWDAMRFNLLRTGMDDWLI